MSLWFSIAENRYTEDMQITGIIAEYNPLHQGHIYHIQQTRKLLHPDVLVVLVSSYFSQRALPSLLSPSDKARMALQAGADLVIELPVVYAAQAADQFALYSLEALKTAGVTTVCFGSETNDMDYLKACVQKLEQAEKNPVTSMARNLDEVLQAPGSNDILGIQYVRWAEQFGIEPVCIQRSGQYKSATATRKDFFEGKSQFLDELFLERQNWDNYYPYLRLFLQETNPQTLSEFFLVSEGIENRLIRLAKEKETWNEFLEAAITRTYSRARIQRTCLFILLQISRKDMQEHNSFFALKILGANSTGRKWLASLPEGTPIYSRYRQMPDFLQMVERKSRALYNAVLSVPVKEQVIMI